MRITHFSRDDLPPPLSKHHVQADQVPPTMWDKLRIRERERTLGMLFMGILAAAFGYGLLALGFPEAARAGCISVLGIFWLFTVRRLVRLRQNKYGAAPVGPLSPDEKLKARSKLLNSASRARVYN
jgi:hypothetical protein